MDLIKNSKAHALAEYALILGVGFALFSMMMIYVQRNTQLRLKNMTDYFISPQQLTTLDSTTTEESKVEVESSSEGYIANKEGGGMVMTGNTQNSVVSTSVTEDDDVSTGFLSLFVSKDAGKFQDPPLYDKMAEEYLSDLEQMNWQEKTDIAALEADKDKLLERAGLLESNADTYARNVGELDGVTNGLGLFGVISGIINLLTPGLNETHDEVAGKIENMRQAAATLRETADQIQARIDLLRG